MGAFLTPRLAQLPGGKDGTEGSALVVPARYNQNAGYASH